MRHDQSKGFVCGHVMAQKTCPSPTHTLVWRTMARLSDNPKINFLMDWPKKSGCPTNKNIYLRQIISHRPEATRSRSRITRQKMLRGLENSSACMCIRLTERKKAPRQQLDINHHHKPGHKKIDINEIVKRATMNTFSLGIQLKRNRFYYLAVPISHSAPPDI